jgi:hypothetical protein
MFKVSRRVADTCKVTCVDNGKKVDADVIEFKDASRLIVSINKSLKVTMPWNGQVFEGHMAGLTFTSGGPIVNTFYNGRTKNGNS